MTDLMNKNTLKEKKLKIIVLLLIVFAASFSVKLGYALKTAKIGVVAQDTIDYMCASDELMKGRIFSSTDDDLLEFPGFPLYLSGLRFILGDDIFRLSLASLLLYAVISALTCYLAYIAFGEGVAVTTAPFAIFSPLMMFWGAYVLTESLFTFLLLIAIFVLARMYHEKNRTPLFFVFGGFALGYASWTRPTLIMIILLIPIWLYFLKKDNRNISSKNMAIFITACLMTYAGWAARNWAVTGATYTPFTRAVNILEMKFSISGSSNEEQQHPSNIIQNGHQEGSTKFVARKLFDAFIVFWHPSIRPTSQNFWNSYVIRYFVLFNCIAFALMVLSIGFLKRNRAMLSLCWLPIVYFTVVHTVMAGWPNINRYRVPIEPYICILAGYSLFQIWYFVQERLKKTRVKENVIGRCGVSKTLL